MIEAAYYNENNPYCYAWLCNLIAHKLIEPGDVDGRSIQDVPPADVMPYRQAHFFAGIGVWSYALRKAQQRFLTARSKERIWTGSCPCQPFSSAGARKGFADERHLWPSWFHLIQQCRPELILGEQVAHGSGIDFYALVQQDLVGEQYEVGHGVLDAGGFGAPHKRARRFFVGYNTRTNSNQSWSKFTASRRARRQEYGGEGPQTVQTIWTAEPRPFPLADGSTKNVHQIRAFGNAIVAPVAVEFIRAALACRP